MSKRRINRTSSLWWNWIAGTVLHICNHCFPNPIGSLSGKTVVAMRSGSGAVAILRSIHSKPESHTILKSSVVTRHLQIDHSVLPILCAAAVPINDKKQQRVSKRPAVTFKDVIRLENTQLWGWDAKHRISAAELRERFGNTEGTCYPTPQGADL